MYRTKSLSAAVAALLCFTAAALPAATIVVQDTIDDYEAQKRSNGTPLYAASENNPIARVGHQTNFNSTGTTAPGGIAAAFFFPLPSLAPGESITSATFGVGLVPDSAASAVTPTFNADLYVLGVIDTNSKSPADAEKFWYTGNTAQSALPSVPGSTTVGGSVSRVADNFIVPTDFIANGGTADTVPITASVTSYIQNLYSNPAANGFTPGTSFLVMRVNADADTPPSSGTQRYSLSWQGTLSNGGAGAAEIRPQITFETVVVPEPSTIGILALAAFALLFGRASRA